MNHEKKKKKNHCSVNLTNKGTKALLSLIHSFFLFFDIRRLIRIPSLQKIRLVIRSF